MRTNRHDPPYPAAREAIGGAISRTLDSARNGQM